MPRVDAPSEFFEALTSRLASVVPISCLCEQVDAHGNEFKFTHNKKTLIISEGTIAPRFKSAKCVLSKEGVSKTHEIFVWTTGPPVNVRVGTKKATQYRTLMGAVCELVNLLK